MHDWGVCGGGGGGTTRPSKMGHMGLGPAVLGAHMVLGHIGTPSIDHDM